MNDTKHYLSQLLRAMERPLSISNDKTQRLLIREIEEKVFEKKASNELKKKNSSKID